MRVLAAVLFALLFALPAAAQTDDAQPAHTSDATQPRAIGRHTADGFYPREAQRLGHEGNVLVTFVITEAGTVDAPRVAKSSGDAELDAAALAAVRTWRYEPATRGGRAVRVTHQAILRFSLSGSGSTQYRSPGLWSFMVLPAAFILGPFVLLFAGCVYFIPSLVAVYRAAPRRRAVFVLNLLLGWTVLGWIAALVWTLRQPAFQAV